VSAPTPPKAPLHTRGGVTLVVVFGSVVEVEVRRSSSSSPVQHHPQPMYGRAACGKFQVVGSGRRPRGQCWHGVFGGGSYRRSGHAVGDILGLYHLFADPASAVV